MSQRTDRILLALREIMLTPTARDEQVTIGPSDLGDPCDYHLGMKMAGEKPQREFSMFPWLGTAIHTLIEKLVSVKNLTLHPGMNEMAWELFGAPSGARTEVKIFICNIPGYGDVWGSIDVLLIGENCIVDWKSSSLKKIKTYKLHGLDPSNQGQVIMYIGGARKAGYNVEAGVLVYIPRDGGDPSQIYAVEVPWDEAEFNSIIERATVIQQWVAAGRWRELDRDPHCYSCNPGYRP